jgi:hypothetical protein
MTTPSPSRTALPTLGTFVRFEKLAERVPGVVPVSYWCEGILINDVLVGESAVMIRDRRAAWDGEDDYEGVRRLGRFNTSAIQSITEERPDVYTLVTRNSTWRLTVLRAECDPAYRPELAARP